MTEAQANRRERSLEWIAYEFHLYGRSMAEALRSGTRAEREAALARMEAHARAERARGLAGHWTYDLARHVELVRIIERERARLAEDMRAARHRYEAVGRQVRRHLQRHRQVPISLMRRLGTARSEFMAAIAGREEGEAR